MKKIAMLLRYEKLDSVFDENCVHAMIFELSDDIMIKVENEYLSKKDINYLSLWLIRKGIKEVYVCDTDDRTRDYFKRVGILIKKYDELENKELFDKYLE